MIKAWIKKIEKMIVNTMNNPRRTPRYINCKRCNQQIPRNKSKQCNKCKNETISNLRVTYNNNEGDDEDLIIREQLGDTIRYNTNINKQNIELKN